MNSKADLERFFEKDIIEWLDQKVKGTNKFQELEKKLKEKNYDEADVELEKLVKEYNELSENNVYKEILFNKMSDLMTKIETEIYKNKAWDTSLGIILSKINDLNIFEGEMPSRINVYDERHAAKEKEMDEKRKRDYSLKEELDKKLKLSGKKLFVYLRKEQLKDAVDEYKNLKEYFEKYPSRFNENKESVYNDLLAYYAQIQRLRKKVEQEPPEERRKHFVTTKKTEEQEKKYLKPDFLNGKVQEIKEMVKRGEFDEANNILLDLRHKTSNLSNDQKHLSEIINSKLYVLKQKIDFIRKKKEEEAIN